MRSVLLHLTAVHWTALAVAIACQVAKLLTRSRAWHNLLLAAFPGSRLRWRTTAAAVLVSAGVNTAAPARLGDVVKVATVRRALGGRCCVATVGATLVVEVALDAVLAALLVGGVVLSGRLVAPGAVAGSLGRVLGEGLAKPWLLGAGVAVIIGLVAGACRLARRGRAGRADRARRFASGVVRGLAGLRDPRWYISEIASWQVLSWCFRLCCVFFALRAFGIEATPTVALLVVAAQILSGVVPVAGGAGMQQALVAVALTGHAGVAEAVAFSLGLQATVALTNTVLAFGVGAAAVQRLGLGPARALAARRPAVDAAAALAEPAAAAA